MTVRASSAHGTGKKKKHLPPGRRPSTAPVDSAKKIWSLNLDYRFLVIERFFFGLMAAWLNEGRCPGGRPSVSTNYITIEASVFCIEMTTVHAIYKHEIKLAVSQRVPFG